MSFKNKNRLSCFFILVAMFFIVFGGCKKQNDTYYKFKNTAGRFNGTALQYLQSQGGVYDSMLLAISRVPGLEDTLNTENVTLFALTNGSFTLALQNLNQVRLRENPPRHPLSIATLDSSQLDTLLCRYIIRGHYPTDSISPYEDGLEVQSIRYGYDMQIQYQRATSSGYGEGGPESLIFSDRNNSIFERYWVGAVTNAVDIKTSNAIVHVLSPGHDFGFGQIVKRMDVLSIEDLWTLVFEDNFNTEGNPDKQNWNFSGRGTSAWNRYCTDSSNVAFVKDGMLKLGAVVSTDTHDTVPYQTGSITTRGKFSFLYGKLMVRAKLPEGQGTWPAIWLMPQDNAYGSWPGSGEIDVMEHLNFDDHVYQTIHSDYVDNLGHTSNPVNSHQIFIDTSGFNTYGMEWYPDSINFFINGIKSFSYPRKPDATDSQWPFDRKFYLILDMAVGGQNTWPGPINNAHLPAVMEVDWVKVYRRN